MESIPSFCKNDPRHILTRANLKMTLPEEEYNKRIKRYINDCKICGNDANCLAQANTNLSRDKSIYPWPNYDWNYSNYVDNNYSAQATGSDANAGVFKNLSAGVKIAKGYLIDPNPGTKSKPNGNDPWDTRGDFPSYGCTGSNSIGCQKWWNVKKNADTSVPYNDPFFKNRVGTESSSYYTKIGYCDRPDIKDKNNCTKKGFSWIGDKCYQDRYAYINNESGVGFLRGFIPSMMTDIFSLNPIYINNTYDGLDTPAMQIQKCPKIEEFVNIEDNSNIYIGLLFGIILLIMSKKLLK
jgi:hypothetical protein